MMLARERRVNVMEQRLVEAPMAEMHNIWKRFPGVVANMGVNLELRVGEVHALLGENGAGKTTLMNILSGLYRPDAGEIRIEGRKVDIGSPVGAIQLGVGMVHQHFRLVDDMSVAENIHLGWSDAPRFISQRLLARRVRAVAEELDFQVDPDARISQLSVGEQQRVEILKVLARGARVLILDEPTSVLTPTEAAELFKVLREMAATGRGVIFISHKLDEVLQVSDRVSVLRGGRNVGTKPISECSSRSLARMMMGEEVAVESRKKTGSPGSIVLKLRGVRATNDRGLPALKDVDLTVRCGEILGIAGVAGNGQRELAEVVTGLRPLAGGEARLEGDDLRGQAPSHLSQIGLGHIPEDRLGMGLFPSLSVLHNAILREYRNPPLRRGLRLVREAAARAASGLVERAGVRVAHLGVPVSNLSGGNQQKLVIRREMEIASRLLVAVHPTRGLDVGATEDVRRALVNHRNNGVAVLLISEDLDEILFLSDRIAVMFGGRIVGIMDIGDANREDIGLLMGGKALEEATLAPN